MGDKMKKLIFFLCATLLIVSSSCSTKEDTPEYPVATEMIKDVTVFTNPDYPRDGRVAYSLIEEVSIGEEVGAEEYLLNRPFDLKIDDQDFFYIQDWMDCHILVYDENGRYVRTIGRKGQGPGEFLSPAFFDFSQDGRLFVNDGRNQRITIFDHQGNPLGDFRLEGFYGGLIINKSDRIYLQKRSQKKEVEATSELQEVQMITSVYSMNLDGQNMTQLIDIETETVRTQAVEGGSVTVSGPRWERFVWALNPEGKLYAGFSKTYQITVLSAEDTEEFRFGREYTPVANEAHIENPRIAEFHPAFYPHLVIDGDGNCWIRLFTPADFEGYLYDIFNANGIYIEQTVLPYPLHLIKDGKAYSLLATEFDYPMVKRFRLEK
jgi:hypothetical protein